MGRYPINSTTTTTSDNNTDPGLLKKGPWSPEEDQMLIDYIQKHGQGKWQLIPKKSGLNRCGKSCRLRWTNYLRPDIKRGNFSPQEEQTIIDLHSSLGNKWSMIATQLPGRTDNEIKNYWNTHLRKKLLRAGIDPKTHQLITDFNSFLVNLPTYNLNSLMNPLQNLATIRLLRNILHVMNSSSNRPPSFLDGSDQILYNHGISTNPTTLQQVQSTATHVNMSGDFQDTYRTMPLQVEQGMTAGNIANTEYCLPGLVSSTPEMQSDRNYDDQLIITSDNKYDTWGNDKVEDEASAAFWSDVLNDESFLEPPL